MELLQAFPFQKDLSYGFPEPGKAMQYEAASNCSYIEFLQYKIGTDINQVVNEGTLNDAGLKSWLSQDLSLHHKRAGDTLVGGLRLLLGVCRVDESCDIRTIPFSKEGFERVEQHLGLPEIFKDCLVANTSRTFTLSCPKGSGNNYFHPSKCYIFRFEIYRPSYYQLALSHDPNSDITTGIILCKSIYHEYPLLLNYLKSHASHTIQPLLTATLVAPIVLASAVTRIHAANKDVLGLEVATGQHEYINVPRRNPLEMDFVAATRRLNFVTRMLAVEKLRVLATLLALESIIKEMGEGGTIAPEKKDMAHSNSARAVKELVDCHIDACHNLVLRIDYEDKMAQTQLSVVYQFMAQKEAIVNSQLAKTSTIIAQETKKDSSSMKAVAVLTMCFLPGTFLAAIFAMPLFNWDNGSHPVIKAEFKYYWAIAVPMTISVLLFWWLAVALPWRKWFEKTRNLPSYQGYNTNV